MGVESRQGAASGRSSSRNRTPISRRGTLVAAAVLVVAAGGAYAVWREATGVHTGDSYEVTLMRSSACIDQADPLWLDGWGWKVYAPIHHGDGPIPGTLRIDSAEQARATFTAEDGWSVRAVGFPDGIVTADCAVPG